ncbi:hypothetical protein IAT40_004790 [Kwoniella sp. CBS 6097]
MSKLALFLSLAWLSSSAVPAVAINSFMGYYITLPSSMSQVDSDDLPVGASLPRSSADCATTCRNVYSVQYSVWQDASSECYCGDTAPRALSPSFDVDITAGSVSGCTDNTRYYTYMLETSLNTHEAGAYGDEASTFVRRQLRERIQIARDRALRAICPNHMTACKVSSADEASFECIDTLAELESCGGCVHGEFNNATGIIGSDCSNSVGVAFGASTCQDGQCVAFACKKGYTLIDGECIS